MKPGRRQPALGIVHRTRRALWLASAVGLLSFTSALIVGQKDQPPRFQSSVDVTSIDVRAVYDDGRPVTDLRPADFKITIDGTVRRVVSADWVPWTTERLPQRIGPSELSSNQLQGGGRLIIVVIDQPNIRFGGAVFVRDALLRFVDRLQPADRVAVLGVGPGARSVPFTTDREQMKHAISNMVGQRGLAQSDVVKRLQTLFEALSTIDGPKTLLLVSEGISIQSEERSRELERLAAGARTIVYGIRLDQRVMNAGDKEPAISEVTPPGRSTIELKSPRGRGLTQSLPDLPFPKGPAGASPGESLRSEDGLYFIAAASGGSVFTAAMNGDYAVQRIESELSGYYIVGVETGRTKSEGRRPITVDVERPGVTVRSRRQLSMGTTIKRASPSTVLEALDSPLITSVLPLRIRTISSMGPLLLRAEVGAGYVSPTRVDLGYVITDGNGRTVGRKVGNSLLNPVAPPTPSPLQLLISTNLRPGKYLLKLAVIEAGRLGSGEHSFQVPAKE
jgi:VWFA-related protein